jgi:hypothetical protein
MVNKVTFCLDDESGEDEEQEDEAEEELGDQSEAEDVGDLDDLLERANVELGGAITGPSRNKKQGPTLDRHSVIRQIKNS